MIHTYRRWFVVSKQCGSYRNKCKCVMLLMNQWGYSMFIHTPNSNWDFWSGRLLQQSALFTTLLHFITQHTGVPLIISNRILSQAKIRHCNSSEHILRLLGRHHQLLLKISSVHLLKMFVRSVTTFTVHWGSWSFPHHCSDALQTNYSTSNMILVFAYL